MYKLDKKIYFMRSDCIQDGVISQVTQTRSGYIYEIEYYNEESEFCQTELNHELVFETIDDLLFYLESQYVKKMELNNE